MHLRRTLTVLAAATGLTAGLLSAGVPAQAASSYWYRGHCVGNSGPKCYFWKAKVDLVADGDTIKVRVLEGSNHSIQSVRFIGINAMEMHVYSHHPSRWKGECYAIPATRYVYNMVKKAHGIVRLAAQHPGDKSGHRLRRDVAVKVHGKWVDIDKYEVAHGMALWLVDKNEYAWDHSYGILTQQAEQAHKGLFSGHACGTGPAPVVNDQTLKVWVKWDADGDDGQNVNGEWARLRNDTGSTVNLSGWRFRDSWYRGYKARGYVFPKGTVLAPGDELTLHAGHGTNNAAAHVYYWGQKSSVWENADGPTHWDGDGGYLFDTKGNLRSWFTYPCFVSCADPLDGKLQVRAQTYDYHGHTEYMDITNTSSQPVNLEGYLAWQNPDSYAFHHSDVVAPGATLRLYMHGNPANDRPGQTRYWGLPKNQLGDGKDTVSVINYTGRTEASCSWTKTNRGCLEAQSP